MRLCTKCGVNLQHDYPSQHSTYCRECHRQRAAVHRASNLPQVRQGDRNSQSKCMYGITLEEKETRLKKQKRRCAVCGTKNPGTRGWCTDHSHLTQTARGIVCSSCNSMLGFAKDSVVILASGIRYLRHHAKDPIRSKIPTKKPCAHCGAFFQPRKYNIYCSGACNQAAYRKRKRSRQ
jgi:DNA-directed RNA polymerase subunit RPC12/RpoP